MRILIVQATRMGDVLQTSPLVRAARRQYPDAHIAVLVRKMGVPIAKRHPDIDEVLVYDEDEMFLALRAKDSDRLLHAYEIADGYITMLRDKAFDLVINCTHSHASALLLKLAGIPRVIGAHLTDEWQYIVRGRWTNYFFTSVCERAYNDINLCDILRNFLEDAPPCRELVFDVRGEDAAFVEDLLARHGIAPDALLVCMQLGASEAHKRWDAGRFGELARLVQERLHARILLVGVESERRFGEAFEAAAPGIATHLFGETSIPQLAALLARSRFLVTNDTGTMHIAASVRCPVVLASVGNVHFRETGPFGEGHCAIERRRVSLGRSDYVPSEVDERTCISADDAYRAVETVLRDDAAQPVRQIGADRLTGEVDLYVTRFAADGYLEWYPVVRQPLRHRDFFRHVYRAAWLEHLDATQSPETEHASATAMFRCYLPPVDGEVATWVQEGVAVFARLAALADKGVAATEDLIDVLVRKDLARARDLVRRLAGLDDEIQVYGELYPETGPVVSSVKYERDNLEGADPLVLAQTTFEIYRACGERCRLVQAKLARMAVIWQEVGEGV